jgi:hypothetical protein
LSTFNLKNPEKIFLKNHPGCNESMIQDIIAQNPGILGLGDLVLKDKERVQPKAGRLDILLQDPEINKRYEVEIQLGKTDETHIIRTIEYWDIERRRYPQYEHCAVIIAEEITSRFMNVISLFNGNIPLIAIQMNAYKYENDYLLTFTKVLDEMNFGLVDEDEESNEVTDRNYWETKRANAKTLKIVDEALAIVQEIIPGFELKYNKFYIGMALNGRADNFIIFRPTKNLMRMEIRMDKSEELEAKIESNEIDLMDYDRRNNRYRINFTLNEIKKHKDFIIELIKIAKNHDLVTAGD